MRALIYEKNKYTEVDIPDGRYVAFTEDMDEPCTCPCCGKDYKFGDMYTSRKYYRAPKGVFAHFVCGKCYEKEWENT